MKPKLKNRWLFFLPLLFTPVMGEMVINSVGLPTPWPIALISTLISVVGIFTFSYEKLSFGWFAKSILFYTIFRSLLVLIKLPISLVTSGIENFQYPSFTLLNSLPLALTMLAVRGGLDKLEAQLQNEEIALQDLPTQEDLTTEEVSSQVANSNYTEAELIGESDRRKLEKNYETLTKVYAWRYLCWGIVGVNFLCQTIVAFYISSNANLKNFRAGSQFIANCTEQPFSKFLGITANSTKYSLVHCEADKTCFITDTRLWSINMIAQLFGIFALVVASGVFAKELLRLFRRCCGLEREKSWWKIRSRFVAYIISSLTFIICLMVVALEQAKGLDPEGLEKCDLNYTLLSSKTGYLQEWWSDKSNTVRHIALV